MAQTVTIDRPPVAKPVSRPRSSKPATVSASVLALHLDSSRTYTGKLEAEGVIRRHGDGFPLDQSGADAASGGLAACPGRPGPAATGVLLNLIINAIERCATSANRHPFA
jgi:hypothetical protein